MTAYYQTLRKAGPPPFSSSDVDPLQALVDEQPLTVFSKCLQDTEGLKVSAVPLNILEHYFKATQATRVFGDDRGSADKRENYLTTLGIKLRNLGIKLRENPSPEIRAENQHAIRQIKRSILSCQFALPEEDGKRSSEGLTLERMHVLRNLVTKAEEEASQVASSYHCYHLFISEMRKVPQIDERLECMSFILLFRANFSARWDAQRDVAKALDLLHNKRSVLQRLFYLIMDTVQWLSREPGVQRAERGFQLATLELLAKTKTTKCKDLTVLHIVLALMEEGDLEDLFGVEDIAVLARAKSLKTHKVYTECNEMVDGFFNLDQMCKTGKFSAKDGKQPSQIQKRRKTRAPGDAPGESDIDADDKFQETMEAFVEHELDRALEMGVATKNMILHYHALAVFFRDMKHVWPPPADEQTQDRSDLVDVFWKFADDIDSHRELVRRHPLLRNMRMDYLRPTEAPERELATSPPKRRPARLSGTPTPKGCWSPGEFSSRVSMSPRSNHRGGA